MTRYRAFSKLIKAAAFLALPLLAACDTAGLYPPADPVVPAPKPTPEVSPGAARAQANSQALRDYYARVLSDGLTRGLLRTDGGGLDTPYTSAMLARNFEQIAFFSEYQRGVQPLRRWTAPVRIRTHFGASVDSASRAKDANAVASFANRLQRITQHPVAVTSGNANFHVFFANEMDRNSVIADIRRLEPAIDAATLQTIRDLPRSTYCLVVAFTPANAPGTYTRAFALIRGEQPDLMRLSCIHEELAQGMGLANDSPFARPSIFNDDDEFALLTTHDEQLLQLLYNPSLPAGVSLDAARPLIRALASAMIDGNV